MFAGLKGVGGGHLPTHMIRGPVWVWAAINQQGPACPALHQSIPTLILMSWGNACCPGSKRQTITDESVLKRLDEKQSRPRPQGHNSIFLLGSLL